MFGSTVPATGKAVRHRSTTVCPLIVSDPYPEHYVCASPGKYEGWNFNSGNYQEIPRILEPEGSSPYSQVPATCPYPQPTPSSPHSPRPLPEDPS